MNPLIPPPVVALLLGAAMWAVARFLPWGRFEFAVQIPLAIVLLAVGLMIALAAVVPFITAKTTINPMRPERASSLITDGIYRYSRNPIYLADAVLLAALAMSLGNIVNCLILLLFLWIIQRFQIAAEERALSKLFGERYTAYCSKVRRWL
jgi:protein-S-isoprenylcysteine O-methyltransferase Ste14